MFSSSSDDDDIIFLIFLDIFFRLFFERFSLVSCSLMLFLVLMLNNLFLFRLIIDKYGSLDIIEKLKFISLFFLRLRVIILGKDLKVLGVMVWMLLDFRLRFFKLCRFMKLLFDNLLILLFEIFNLRSLNNDKNRLFFSFGNLLLLMFKDCKFLSVDKLLG